MKLYKDLFIDFDDTLYDTRGNAIIALSELYEEMGFGELLESEEKFYEAYWQTNLALWGQYSRNEITRDYLIVERFRRPLSECAIQKKENWPTADYCLQVSDVFLSLCSSKPGLLDGARELMDDLRRKGYRMHLCSNGFHEVQYKKLRACGLMDYFDSVILSEDAGANKPSATFFEYALRTTGAKRESTLMIGDNYQSDIVGALDAGIDAMLYLRWDPDFVPPRKVNYVVPTLRDISAIL